MLPSHKTRILIATQPVDFRTGHDGLAALVQSALKEDPFTGAVFVFRAKRVDRLKILFWDGSGLWVCAKRLEKGRFGWPEGGGGQSKVVLSHEELALLLGGIDLAGSKRRAWYRRVSHGVN